jgi:hypothetical protein
MMAASIGKMIIKLSGMLGTDDLNSWEDGFIGDMYERTDEGKNTINLSGPMIEKIEQIYRKHFAD